MTTTIRCGLKGLESIYYADLHQQPSVILTFITEQTADHFFTKYTNLIKDRACFSFSEKIVEEEIIAENLIWQDRSVHCTTPVSQFDPEIRIHNLSALVFAKNIVQLFANCPVREVQAFKAE